MILAVTSYAFPDTDGVASAIGYASLRNATDGARVEPVVFGELHPETLFVLHALSLTAPTRMSRMPDDWSVVLVDTHQLNQLPPGVSPGAVVEIVDHHPTGDDAFFSHAKVQNEPVGAAATLIAERFRSEVGTCAPAIAGLLAAGIVSNTLNFTAASSTTRDSEALAWLHNFAETDTTFFIQMLRERDGILALPTIDLLERDFKVFDISGSTYGIAQIEVVASGSLLERADLEASLECLRTVRGVDYLFLNVVELATRSSTLVAADSSTKAVLASRLAARFERHAARFDRVLLRKSDLLPALMQQQ